MRFRILSHVIFVTSKTIIIHWINNESLMPLRFFLKGVNVTRYIVFVSLYFCMFSICRVFQCKYILWITLYEVCVLFLCLCVCSFECMCVSMSLYKCVCVWMFVYVHMNRLSVFYYTYRQFKCNPVVQRLICDCWHSLSNVHHQPIFKVTKDFFLCPKKKEKRE